MSIRSVFRVQCDGSCKGWLSCIPHRTELEIPASELTARPTAEHACTWSGERAARIAARSAGWIPWRKDGTRTTWLCPGCRDNPLDIVLPPEPCRQCGMRGPHKMDCTEPPLPSCSDPELGHQFQINGQCAFCTERVDRT